MLTEEQPDLRTINDRAAFIVADGKPLVWASRMLGTPLPERVAGSDLIFHLCEEAAPGIPGSSCWAAARASPNRRHSGWSSVTRGSRSSAPIVPRSGS